jgi:hypothetical protein
MLLRAPKNNGRATKFRAAQIFKLDYGQFVESWFPGNNYICKNVVHGEEEFGRVGDLMLWDGYIHLHILYGASNCHLPSHKSIPICKSRQTRTSCIIIIILCGFEEISGNGQSINISYVLLHLYTTLEMILG